MLPNFKLKFKLFFVFLLISAIPAFFINFIWLSQTLSQIDLSLHERHITVWQNFSLIIIMYLIIVLIFSALSFWIAKTVSAPLEKIKEWSSLIGLGMLDRRLDIKSKDEFQELAISFNLMASNMQEAMGKLEKDKEVISAERNKLQVVISGISDAVIAVDLQRRVITFNKKAQEITGILETEAVGKLLSDLIKIFDKDKELDPKLYCPLESRIGEGIVYLKKDLKIISANQKQREVDLIASTIFEGAAVNLGCILTLKDITKQKELEKMKLDFVSIAAHELRTPVTSIRGYLYLIMTQYGPILNTNINKYLNRVNISAQRLLTLIENLLQIAGIEKGALTLSLQPVEWVRFVMEVTESFQDQAKEKEIELTFQKPGLPIQVSVDKVKMTEALANFIENAIVFTPKGGKIRVLTLLHGNQVITHIQDTGPGIPEQALPHLFTKFYQITDGLPAGSKGIGLGLFIARSIILKHQGQVWVDSQLGQGSTFSFSLPCQV